MGYIARTNDFLLYYYNCRNCWYHILYAKICKRSVLLAISLSVILGGAIGNFIDRLFRKEVVDFLDVMIFSYDFPIFNVADSCLTVGVILFFIATFMDEKRKGKRA